MVAQTMGSHGGGSSSAIRAQAQNPGPTSNALVREGSLYSLTLDEVQNQLGDLGKPLSSMNLDELLKSVWTVEANNNNQTIEGVNNQLALHHPNSSVNQESAHMLSNDLSKKTVDEVWQDIQEGQREGSRLDRKSTLGEMTLEDFLVKAGVVAESASGHKQKGSVLGVGDEMPQAHWMNYQIPPVHSQPQSSMLPVFMPGHQHPIGGNLMTDGAYPETQIAMSSSPLMGALSDTQTPGRKRVAPEDVAEKSVERRQKRMIKNRESAARSRARKQAYTHELENKISLLEEENERLKRQQELEKALPSVPPPEPKYQLRRTSSAPI